MKVTNVEIREIIPPPAVQEAMTRQMSAERTRRAVVTEAEGRSRPPITVAEGNKQAAILTAEGDRQAAILRAEGFSLALDKIFEVAQDVDAKTMSLQYLEALKQIGSSPSTKFVVPMEFAGLCRRSQASRTIVPRRQRQRGASRAGLFWRSPGWRNWSYAPGLKPGVPSGA